MSAPRPVTRVLEGAPSTLPMMLRSALPAVPLLNRLAALRKSGTELPDLTLSRLDVAVDRAHMRAYSELCGFPLTDSLPLPYPHILAFGLHLTIMTDRAFPFTVLGLVHLENAITQHRAIGADERLQLTAWPHRLRAHPKGRLFDISVEVHSAGELVWQSTSTLLRLGSGSPEATANRLAFEAVPGLAATWRLPADLGRRYAAVSGDRNPIHLYALSAKAFGFPRQIAHGMWSKAHCLAALQGRLPHAVRVDVAFKKPILLPGTVAFGSSRAGDGYDFMVSNPMDGAPHLIGRATPL